MILSHITEKVALKAHTLVPARPALLDPQQLTAELAQWDEGRDGHANHPSQPLGGALHEVECVRREADSYTGVHRGIIHPEWDRWRSMTGRQTAEGSSEYNSDTYK